MCLGNTVQNSILRYRTTLCRSAKHITTAGTQV